MPSAEDEVFFWFLESYRWEFIKQESAGVKQLAAETGYPEVFAGLLAARGVHNKEEAQRFLYPSEKNMYDPFLMKGMEAAVCRISQAMDAHEKITIYGDYDVDGITATSILYLYLSKAGAEVDYYLPDRMTEGYGLNENAVRMLAETGTKLMVTVDTGISLSKSVSWQNHWRWMRLLRIIMNARRSCRRLWLLWMQNSREKAIPSFIWRDAVWPINWYRG